MSTLKTINVIHPSGSTNNIVNDASGNATVGNNLYVTTNAGIGTTSPGALLEVSAANASVYSAIRMTNTTGTGTTPGAGIEWARGGTVKSSITANTFGNDYMAFNVNGNTERMRIDTSGNVGIGTTSPTQKFDCNGPMVTHGVLTADQTNAGAFDYTSGSTRFSSYGTSAGIFQWYSGVNASAPSERMRIDTSGNLLVGTTTLTDGSRVVIRPATNQPGLTVQQNGVGDYCVHLNAVNNSGFFYYQYFVAGSTAVGSISSNTTTTTYATTSDYRLKYNMLPITNGVATINALKPVHYDWKLDGSKGEGFLAHELQEIIPHAVTGEKDAVETVEIKDEEGNVTGTEERIKPQGVDYSKIVVHLVAAIQEQQATITALTARVAALEAK